MGKMGFQEDLVDLVMRCVTTATFSTLVNGRPTGHIIPQRGIRQGCPLSPYLFLICSEGLSCLLNNAEANRHITGIKVARTAPSISHLLFADDCLIFTKALPEEANRLKLILESYERASGQCINYHKLKLTFSPNTNEEMKRSIQRICRIEVVSCHEKYLGLPTTIARNTIKVFDHIQERVAKKLGGWRERLISAGGKETLLKAVVQATPIYPMSLFRIPKGVIKVLNRLMGNFWWGGSEEGRKIHWRSWETMCKPKWMGGMGIRDFEAFNQALLAK